MLTPRSCSQIILPHLVFILFPFEKQAARQLLSHAHARGPEGLVWGEIGKLYQQATALNIAAPELEIPDDLNFGGTPIKKKIKVRKSSKKPEAEEPVATTAAQLGKMTVSGGELICFATLKSGKPCRYPAKWMTVNADDAVCGAHRNVEKHCYKVRPQQVKAKRGMSLITTTTLTMMTLLSVAQLVSASSDYTVFERINEYSPNSLLRGFYKNGPERLGCWNGLGTETICSQSHPGVNMKHWLTPDGQDECYNFVSRKENAFLVLFWGSIAFIIFYFRMSLWHTLAAQKPGYDVMEKIASNQAIKASNPPVVILSRQQAHRYARKRLKSRGELSMTAGEINRLELEMRRELFQVRGFHGGRALKGTWSAHEAGIVAAQVNGRVCSHCSRIILVPNPPARCRKCDPPRRAR